MQFLKNLFGRKNGMIDEFSQNMADELFSSVQPEVAEKYVNSSFKEDAKSTSQKEHTIRKINETIRAIQQFKATHSLGLYQKARLHMKFTERLKELGYSENIAEEINKAIMYRSI